MIGGRRLRGGQAGEHPSSGQAAPRRGAETDRPVRGLAGALARALGLRRAPSEPADPFQAADTAELLALREDLTQELERVASRRPAGQAAAQAQPAAAPPAAGTERG